MLDVSGNISSDEPGAALWRWYASRATRSIAYSELRIYMKEREVREFFHYQADEISEGSSEEMSDRVRGPSLLMQKGYGDSERAGLFSSGSIRVTSDGMRLRRAEKNASIH